MKTSSGILSGFFSKCPTEKLRPNRDQLAKPPGSPSSLIVLASILFLSVFFLRPALAYQLPDTGQHTCYDDQGNEITCPEPGEPFYGQDAQYQGPEPAYQDNGDGTVTDLNTGLIWMQNTADTDGDGGIDSGDELEWQPACDYCADLSYAGHSDWRLPNRRELMSIVDYGRSDPAINPVFDCFSSSYWSGIVNAHSNTYAWSLGFFYGIVHHDRKDTRYFLRCVRGGSNYSHTFVDNNDGTVTDILTGLMWQQGDAHNQYDRRTWQEALSYCKGCTTAGYNDWRLPNVRELESIVDCKKFDNAINYVFESSSSNYWSSSTNVSWNEYAWNVFFYNGFVDFSHQDVGLDGKNSKVYVRCVRDEPALQVQAEEMIIQPGPEEGNDVWVTSVYHDGGEDNRLLKAGGWGDYYHSLIKFDLKGLPSNVIKAKIFLYSVDGGHSNHPSMFLDRVESSWNESTLWNNKPSYTNIRTLPSPAINSWYVFDVTELYNYWKDENNTNNGVQLRPKSNNDDMNAFYSSDYLDNPDLRPKLMLVYGDIFENLIFPLKGKFVDKNQNLKFGADWPWGECPTGVSKRHTGVDLSAQAGESVYTAHSGTVRALVDARFDDWAWAVTIEDDGGEFTTVYWHVIPEVQIGDQVDKGDKIATIADLGNNTHLHFGIRKAPYSNTSNAGALPRSDCGDYPAFPEHFVDPLTYFDSSVQKVALTFKIYDSRTGQALDGATVSLGEKSKTTGLSGETAFQDLAPGIFDVEVIASGYVTSREAIDASDFGDSSIRIGLVPKVTASKPVISDVRSRYSNRNKEAFFIDGPDCDLAFHVHVDWNGHAPKEVRFITPEQTYTVSTDGSQNPSQAFDLGQDFGPGGRLQVVAVSQDGTCSEFFDANIEVMNLPPGLPVGPGLVLGNRDFRYEGELAAGSLTSEVIPGSSTAVPEDIPIFGGKTMGMKILAKVEVEIGSDGSATYSFRKPDKGNELKMAGVNFDSAFELGGDVTFRYLPEQNSWEFDGGYLTGAVRTRKDVGPSYTVVPLGPVTVPVYLRGELEAELDSSIGFTGWAEGGGWELDGTVEPEAGGKAIAGAGVAKALAVEGYLGLDAGMRFGFPEESVFRKATVALSGGINLVMLFFTYEQPLWEYSWQWPDQAGTQALRLPLQEAVQDIRDLSWKPLPRDYSSGLISGRVPLSAPRDTLAGTEQTLPGQSNIFPYSYPSLASIDSDLLLTWISDDLEKSAANRSSLIFSRRSGSQWSTPAKVAEDGTADFYPSLAFMTGGAMAVWQNAGTVFEKNATLEAMLPEQEIAACGYNEITGAWDTSNALTSNAYLDRNPEVAASGHQTMAVWVTNPDNDMLGSSEHPNRLHYALYNGTAWSQEAVLASGLGAIVKSDLVFSGDSAAYVFSLDQDGDVSTNQDQELYSVSYNGTAWSELTRLTNNGVQDVNPQLAYDPYGDLVLVWYKAGEFIMAENLDMSSSRTVVTPGLSSGAADFRLVVGDSGQISLVWPDASSTGQDIFMAVYDATVDLWGKPVQVTDTPEMERSLSSVQTTQNSLAVAYNKIEILEQSKEVNVNGTLVNVTAPEPGRTDLCLADFTIDGDLTIKAGSIQIAPETIQLGDTLGMNATVANTGLEPAQDIAVEWYYGSPDSGGSLIGSRQIIPGPLIPGEEIRVSAGNWTIPDQPDQNKDLYLVVDPDLVHQDRDRTDNTAHVSVFEPDLKVEQMFWQAMGPVKRALTVRVKNEGTVRAENIPLLIVKQQSTNSPLLETSIASLNATEAGDIVYEWDVSNEATVKGYVQALAVINRNQTIQESSYLNNKKTLQILGAKPAAATTPSLSSGTTGVGLHPVLAWDDAARAAFYDLYLWKASENRPQEPKASGLTESSYASDFLDPQTLYHWQVVARNESGTAQGPEWSFTTADILAGDVNVDGTVDLRDAILSLQVCCGFSPKEVVHWGADVNGDGKIGLSEAVFGLQEAAAER